MNGRVKFFDQARGYGFIVRDDRAGDIYFHVSEWNDAGVPAQHDNVSFSVGERKERPAALGVRVR